MNDKHNHNHDHDSEMKPEEAKKECCGSGKCGSVDAHGHYCGWLVSPRFCKRMVAVWGYNALAGLILATLFFSIMFGLGFGKPGGFWGMHGYGEAAWPAGMHREMMDNWKGEYGNEDYEYATPKTAPATNATTPANTTAPTTNIPAADNKPAADTL